MATLSQTRRGGRAAGNPAGSPGTAGGQGPQGTLGGMVQNAMGARPGSRSLQLGDAGYLWILVALEVAALAWGRNIFKRRHGG